MVDTYDYIVIGGGPTGLTLATYLPGKIAVIERHPVLGGCHRVLPRPKFVEHGPRVYSGAYLNVRAVLADLGMRWDDIFRPSTFSPERIAGKNWIRRLSVVEIASLTVDYLVFALFNADHGKTVAMKDYCARRKFSAESAAYIDLVCRFSDGAGADRYSLWEFLSGFDQHAATPFYVPKRPLNALFDAWKRVLENRGRGVDFYLGETVVRVGETAVATNVRVLRARTRVVLAVPPVHASGLLEKSGIHEPRFRAFAKSTRYNVYWSVTFFVDTYEGIPETEWGIVPVSYLGVVSAAATIFDRPSSVTGKTLRQMTGRDDDIAAEIGRQLGLPDGTQYAFLDASTPPDQAFVAAAGTGYFGAGDLECPGIDTVGCHNGHSTYNFTSMESAVQNALVYCGSTPVIPVRGLGRHLSVSILVVLCSIVVVVINTRRSY